MRSGSRHSFNQEQDSMLEQEIAIAKYWLDQAEQECVTVKKYFLYLKLNNDRQFKKVVEARLKEKEQHAKEMRAALEQLEAKRKKRQEEANLTSWRSIFDTSQSLYPLWSNLKEGIASFISKAKDYGGVLGIIIGTAFAIDGIKYGRFLYNRANDKEKTYRAFSRWRDKAVGIGTIVLSVSRLLLGGAIGAISFGLFGLAAAAAAVPFLVTALVGSVVITCGKFFARQCSIYSHAKKSAQTAKHELIVAINAMERVKAESTSYLYTQVKLDNNGSFSDIHNHPTMQRLLKTVNLLASKDRNGVNFSISRDDKNFLKKHHNVLKLYQTYLHACDKRFVAGYKTITQGVGLLAAAVVLLGTIALLGVFTFGLAPAVAMLIGGAVVTGGSVVGGLAVLAEKNRDNIRRYSTGTKILLGLCALGVVALAVLASVSTLGILPALGAIAGCAALGKAAACRDRASRQSVIPSSPSSQSGRPSNAVIGAGLKGVAAPRAGARVGAASPTVTVRKSASSRGASSSASSYSLLSGAASMRRGGAIPAARPRI